MFVARRQWLSSCRSLRRFQFSTSSPLSLEPTTSNCPRAVYVSGLPDGYKLGEVTKAAGNGPLHSVVPFLNSCILKYYTPSQATAAAARPISIDGKEYTLKINDAKPLPPSPIARLCSFRSSRALTILFQAPIDETEVVNTLGSFGQMESAAMVLDQETKQTFLSIVFLSEERAFKCFQAIANSTISSPAFENAEVDFARDPTWPLPDPSDLVETTARKVIFDSSQMPYHRLSSELSERYPSTKKDIVAAFNKPSGMGVTYLEPEAAQACMEIFKATGVIGSILVSRLPVEPHMKLAYEAGARRGLFFQGPPNMEIDGHQLRADFGLLLENSHHVRVVPVKAGFIVKFHSLRHALNTVALISSAQHEFQDKYKNARINFMHHNSESLLVRPMDTTKRPMLYRDLRHRPFEPEKEGEWRSIESHLDYDEEDDFHSSPVHSLGVDIIEDAQSEEAVEVVVSEEVHDVEQDPMVNALETNEIVLQQEMMQVAEVTPVRDDTPIEEDVTLNVTQDATHPPKDT